MPKQKALNAVKDFFETMTDFVRTSEETYYGLHLRDLQVIYFILTEHENHKVTVTELSKHLEVTPAAASQIVTNYENKGWINRVRSTSDRRTVFIEVTQELLSKLNGDLDIFKENLYQNFSDVTDEELEGFSRVMKVIIEYFDQTHPYLGK